MLQPKDTDWLNGHNFQQVLGNDEGQGSLVCCSPWDYRVGHGSATELNPFTVQVIIKIYTPTGILKIILGLFL